MKELLVPTYMSDIPTPELLDRLASFNGLPLSYDQQAIISMSYSPPHDIYIRYGAPNSSLINSPFIYDPDGGHLYYCNDNYDYVNQNMFQDW